MFLELLPSKMLTPQEKRELTKGPTKRQARERAEEAEADAARRYRPDNPSSPEVYRTLHYGFFFDQAQWNETDVDERPRWYTDNMKSYGSAKNTVEHEMMERMKKRPKREEHDTSPAAIRRYRTEMGFGSEVTDADISEMLDPFSEDDDEYDWEDDEDEFEDDEESDDE